MPNLEDLIMRDTRANQPAAGIAGRIYYVTDEGVTERDNGSTWEDVSATGTGGSVATDTIFDAKGDLPVGTGANTAAKLTVGANGTRPEAASGEATGIKWSFPPGHELDYAEFTSPVNVTGTNLGAANTVVASNSVAYDGAAVMVEFFAPRVKADGTANRYMVVELYVDSTDLGQISLIRTPASGSDDKPVLMRRKYTPSAASHVFTVKAWVSAGTGTFDVGAGGAATDVPGYIRITKA